MRHGLGLSTYRESKRKEKKINQKWLGTKIFSAENIQKMYPLFNFGI